MTSAIFLILSLLPPPSATAADALTLKDGKVALGQVVEPSPKGKIYFAVRRDWARTTLPTWSKRWETAEAPQVKQARAQRRARLETWKKDRALGAEKDDAIGPWIVSELAKLDPAKDGDKSNDRLMFVVLPRSDVKRIQRAAPDSGRLLRLAWSSNLRDAETASLADLTSSLAARGFSAKGNEPIALDDFFPLQVEADARWFSRRAATEVFYDQNLRFIRYQGLVMPDDPNGNAGLMNPNGQVNLKDALGALKGLLGDDAGGAAEDPLQAKLKTLAARGRVGALVTSMEMAADFSSVKIESTLLARVGPDRWVPAMSRPVVVRPDDLKPDAGAAIAADPQVKGAFDLVEGLGLGQVDPEMKRRTLQIGAATQKALGTSRSQMDLSLQQLALPVLERDAVKAKPAVKEETEDEPVKNK